MGIAAASLAPFGDDGMALAAINKGLVPSGLSLSPQDMQALAERRTAALADTERIEFGIPVVLSIAGAIAHSPWLTQANVARTLAQLQDSFYALRDELPIHVPDGEIVEALQRAFDTWGDASAVAAMPPAEIMAFSPEYERATEAEASEAYRIVDDEGRAYTYDPTQWDYDEQAPGWDGERWSDDWND